MLDHIGIVVADLPRALAFYDRALTPLGITRILQVPDAGDPVGVGYGHDRKPFFWVSATRAPSGPIHLAFAAATQAHVRAFHEAALRAGGTDNGAPGLRPEYHPSYYGAFVLDPDGNNIEAVNHGF